jgi:hypothetical protein
VRLVVIESPFGKNPDGTPVDEATLKRNERYIRAAMQDCFNRGEAPFASHAIYPAVLNERDPEERKLGMEAGWAWQRVADAIVVYGDLGTTPGMQAGIESATKLGKPVEYRRLGPGVARLFRLWSSKDTARRSSHRPHARQGGDPMSGPVEHDEADLSRTEGREFDDGQCNASDRVIPEDWPLEVCVAQAACPSKEVDPQYVCQRCGLRVSPGVCAPQPHIFHDRPEDCITHLRLELGELRRIDTGRRAERNSLAERLVGLERERDYWSARHDADGRNFAFEEKSRKELEHQLKTAQHDLLTARLLNEKSGEIRGERDAARAGWEGALKELARQSKAQDDARRELLVAHENLAAEQELRKRAEEKALGSTTTCVRCGEYALRHPDDPSLDALVRAVVDRLTDEQRANLFVFLHSFPADTVESLKSALRVALGNPSVWP